MFKKGLFVYLLLLVFSVMSLGIIGVAVAAPDLSLLLPGLPIFFAGPVVKGISAIAEKWARVTPQRSADYEAGVTNPVRDWAKGASEANAAWKAGITEAAAKDRFVKGIAQSGTEKWKRRAMSVGPARFSQGVQVAAPDYEKGFAKFRDVIEKTTLPPRFAKGDPRNIDRVRYMALALAEAKRK